MLTRLLADHRVPDGTWTEIGSLGVFRVAVRVQRAMTQALVVTLALPEVPDGEIRLTGEQLGESALISRLENRLNGLERFRDDTVARIDVLRGEVRTATNLLGRPFPRDEELAAARSRVDQLKAQLNAIAHRQSADVTEPVRTEAEVTADASDGTCTTAARPSLRSGRSDRSSRWAHQADAATQTTVAALQVGRSSTTARTM